MKRFISGIKRLFLLSFVSFFSVLYASAERNIKIKISGEENNSPVRLTLSSSSTETFGNIRITTMNLIVANSSDRILEGELEFPLEEGEDVTGYSVDVNGKLRSGVVVEKEKGREVFEAVVRQGIDPGLIEKTAGNNFKTRIYPIPARGLRQIQIVVQGVIKNPAEIKTGIFTETSGKNTYFHYNTVLPAAEKPKKLPETVAVWWDVSSSGEDRNLDAEIEFLKEYLSKLKVKSVWFRSFSSLGSKPLTFTNTDELITRIRDLEYDGATDMNQDFFKSGDDEVLVFSDGIANWNEAAEQKKSDIPGAKRAVLYTVNSSQTADHAFLSSLARKNGGRYINLTSVSKIDEKISYGAQLDALKKQLSPFVSLMMNEPYRLIRSEYDKSAVSDVYPEDGTIVSADFSFSGILRKKSAPVKLYFGYGNTVEKTLTIKPDSTSADTKYTARRWACMKIASLSENYDRNRTEIIELSKKFGIVTKDTSLIVLDSAADYVGYKIVPPQDDAELLAEYNRLVSRSHSAAANKNEDDGRISREVYDCFAEYKKWWNTPLEEFKKIKALNKLRERDTMYETLEVDGGADESAAPEVVLEERLFADAAPRVSANASARASSRASEPQLLAKTASGEASRSGKNPSVQIQAWSPERKYLAVLKKTPADKMYAKYLELKKEYKSSPAFYMEVSDYFAEEGYEALSLRILSNLAELNLENTDVLRALGNKLMERKNYPSAVSVFEKLIRLKGEIPQFRRDLGMAYHLNGEEQKAVDMLYSIALKKWDSRFDQVQQIALNDMNAIIASCRRENVKLDLSKIDKKLIENFDLDVRVILTWNTDDCDIDLWVTDKDGEKCYYGNMLTANGGRMSRDFTRGYGPEEFSIRTAPDGKLKIEVHYYGNHQQKVLQPVVVQAEVYTNFGRKNQQRQILTLQLDSVEGKFLVGEVEF